MTIDMVEIVIIPENLTSLVRENARTALEQWERAEKERNSAPSMAKINADFRNWSHSSRRRKQKRDAYELHHKIFDMTGEQTGFREELWGGLVDHIRFR